MAKKTNPPKKPHQPVLDESGIELRKPGLNNPALVFLLIALPLLFGILYAFIAPPGSRETTPAVEAAASKKAEAEHMRAPALTKQEMRASGGRNQFTPRSAEGVPDQKIPSCDFSHFVGQKPTPGIEATIKVAGMMIRVLPPGSNMTMDYSTSRVNLELDDQGVIQRVWCG